MSLDGVECFRAASIAFTPTGVLTDCLPALRFPLLLALYSEEALPFASVDAMFVSVVSVVQSPVARRTSTTLPFSMVEVLRSRCSPLTCVSGETKITQWDYDAENRRPELLTVERKMEGQRSRRGSEDGGCYTRTRLRSPDAQTPFPDD